MGWQRYLVTGRWHPLNGIINRINLIKSVIPKGFKSPSWFWYRPSAWWASGGRTMTVCVRVGLLANWGRLRSYKLAAMGETRRPPECLPPCTEHKSSAAFAYPLLPLPRPATASLSLCKPCALIAFSATSTNYPIETLYSFTSFIFQLTLQTHLLLMEMHEFNALFIPRYWWIKQCQTSTAIPVSSNRQFGFIEYKPLWI